MNDARSRSAHVASLGRTKPLGGLVLGVALLAVGFAAWQFATTAQIQPEHHLPAPGRVLEALADHWPNLWAAIVVIVFPPLFGYV